MLGKAAIEEVKRAGAKRVMIQVPEGLKAKALDFARQLEQEGVTVFISAEPCYGSCDVCDRSAGMLGCGLLLHVGHSDFGVKTKVPVFYDEHRMDSDPAPLLESSMDKLDGYQKVCLVTTLQYISALERVKALLESRGKEVLIGRPKKAKHPGQILGCDHSAALQMEEKAECFLFIGTGMFHPLGLAMKTEKPVLFLDTEKGELTGLEEEKDRRLRIRAAHKAKAQDARSFGILVSTKPGQFNPAAAEQAKRELEAKGKEAHMVVMDNISPDKLLGMGFDCLVNCACPRLTEDSGMFKKPMLAPQDVEGV